MPPPTPIPLPGISTREQAEAALRQLSNATVERENEVALRDKKVSNILAAHAEAIRKASSQIETLENQLERFYREHRKELCVGDTNTVTLAHGTLGIRTIGNPALVPLNATWTWSKIESRLKRAFKLRFFHPAKPPALDKSKTKQLSAEDLAKFGLKLDDPERFFIELTRLPEAA